MRSTFTHRPLPVVLLVASAAALGELPGQARIAVGPNVLVSRDGDVAHVESGIASNPRDPLNIPVFDRRIRFRTQQFALKFRKPGR